ncbi:MAG: hypothetical protein GXY98_02835 [Erysipelothrix sp.]|nr:hypothetical protein [Erysipelothrix sp.]
MDYQHILQDLEKLKPLKTKDLDNYAKTLIKKETDVRSLKQHVVNHPVLHRIYFQTSLQLAKDVCEQFLFIEQNQELLTDWWHVDQLTQFVYKPIDFEFAYNKAKNYVQSEKPFTRRWGYVLFLTGLQKDPQTTNKILSLMKNDPAYYTQMAQAWLLCDCAVYNPEKVIEFIKTSSLDYAILGKAIQKMVDSFRISDQDKETVKALRPMLKLKQKEE